MQKPLAVANWFINAANGSGNPPTQMKLQKLMFFAHGWNLALYDCPLVSENFQAWKFGPVVPSVYHEFKNYGLLGIDKPGMIPQINSTGSVWWETPSVEDSSGSAQALLTKVWEVFGGYTGTELSRMTHMPGTPWAKARMGYPEDAHNIPIPDHLIQGYFKSLMAQETSGNG